MRPFRPEPPPPRRVRRFFAPAPFKSTFTIELANGYYGYLPTPEQHEWGGYETWDARSSCLEVSAEPAIRETVLELLRAVRKTSG